MTRRWLELCRTTSARLAVLYVGLFAISVAILFGLIYWAATAALGDRIDQELAVQRNELLAEAVAVENRAAGAVDAPRGEHGELRYQVRDAAGSVIAGNLPPLPVAHPGYQELWLPSGGDKSDREPRLVRALGYNLPHGGLLIVAQDAYALDELRELIIRAFGWGAGATLLLAGIGGAIMAARVTHRVEVINKASERIMAGDLSGRLPLSGDAVCGDEFDRLANNLNRMLDRIEQLVEGMRQVSTDIAHDLRTPLTRLRRNLETVRADAAETASPAHFAAIDGAVAQADNLLATFGGLLRIAQIESRATRFAFATVDLSAIAEAVLEVYRPAAEAKGQTFNGRVADPVYVAGDRVLLTQMVANVAENAIRHAPEGASIEIALQRDGAHGSSLTISDDGPGIPPSERENVFRRFYRLDASRGSPGNGLGLPLVVAVAELHGASVQLSPNIPHGLKVTVAFPPEDARNASRIGAVPSTGRCWPR